MRFQAVGAGMWRSSALGISVVVACALALGTWGCSPGLDDDGGTENPSSVGGRSGSGGSTPSARDGGAGGEGTVSSGGGSFDSETGNPDADGSCEVPEEAKLEDVAAPTTVVGNGTPASCSGDAFIAAVEGGGVITFNCGASPHTIVLDRPAKIKNDTGPRIVIDGGGKVTLSGGGTTRILYMNTCDENQVWTTSHCDNQDHPQLTVQNLTFSHGSSGEDNMGGGAIFAGGGRFKVLNSRFVNNTCAESGPDLSGAAIRVVQQFENRPAYIVNSTFGGAAELGNVCSNGGGLGSIGVNWRIINSLFSHNRAVGDGGNPAQSGTLGGGSGGAIYNDGGTLHLFLCGTKITENTVNAFGAAIFFVSNNHQGTLELRKSTIQNNHGGSWYTLPGVSMHEDTVQVIDGESVIQD
jgi:hypothetical protein